jgi:hypothetical protein
VADAGQLADFDSWIYCKMKALGIGVREQTEETWESEDRFENGSRYG